MTREDILGRISDLAETPTAIRSLKQELKSNYHKLFKESFADKKFKDQWKEFEDLRNKIAHNNLFTAEDLKKGEQLAAAITTIISAADTEAQKLVITNEEREAVKEQVIARSSSILAISEEAFLTELDSQVRAYIEKKQKNGFVGLTKFVSHLSVKGFPYASSHGMIKRLSTAGLIEVHYVSNPYDETKKTAAIRRVQTPTS